MIKTTQLIGMRPKGGKFTIPIKQIDIPHVVHGDDGKGVGRGPGKEGDVVGRDPQPGQGNKAGDGEGEFGHIQVDVDDILQMLGEDLKLPPMYPKPNQTFQEVKIKYNDISRSGPESLRHNRRTMLEALKRLAHTGTLDNLHLLPGCTVPIRLITPINNDKRYRQYREIRIPSSNAVIFFVRDCSGSMDDYRCDIVSDMSWWIDQWIKRFYTKVQRCYIVHDTRAIEVNEEEFYKVRYGGGTMCSSAFSMIADQLKTRFLPSAYNVYIFYFTDGDNWAGDNEKMYKIIKEQLGAEIINLIGITQVCSWGDDENVKRFIDGKIKSRDLSPEVMRTVEIGPKNGHRLGWGDKLEEGDRNAQIIDAIRILLTERTRT